MMILKIKKERNQKLNYNMKKKKKLKIERNKLLNFDLYIRNFISINLVKKLYLIHL